MFANLSLTSFTTTVPDETSIHIGNNLTADASLEANAENTSSPKISEASPTDGDGPSLEDPVSPVQQELNQVIDSQDQGSSSSAVMAFDMVSVVVPQATITPGAVDDTQQQDLIPATAEYSKNKEKERVPPRLSKQLANQHSRNNVIIITWANLHFSDFVLNWVDKVDRHGINNYLVGAMDQDTATFLYDNGVENIFAMYEEDTTDTGLTTEDFHWGSSTFHKMGRQKVELAAMFTSFGLDLCLCDVDTVWINDPTEYFNSYPEADILSSSDLLHPTQPLGDGGLEDWTAVVSSPMNIGLLFFRHSSRVKKFVDAWSEMLESDERIWDQDAFNKLAYGDGSILPDNDDENSRLAWAFNQTLTIGILPVASFASGHTYFVQKLYKLHTVKPYVVHTTFQFGGTAGKRHRLREALLWQDPPEYYSQGQFLEVSITKPEITDEASSLNSGKAMAKFHLKSMAAQLAEVRDAMAIAVTLNRTLIMPKMYCFCDRYWGGLENCRPAGSANYSLPFICPLDHVLSPGEIHGLDEISTMGGVNFREYSFLENPNVPKKITEGVVEVEADSDSFNNDFKRDSPSVSGSGSRGAEDEEYDGKTVMKKTAALVVKETRNAQGKVKLRIPGKLTDVQLKELLGGDGSGRGSKQYATEAPLLRLLGSPSSIFGSFEDDTTHRRFLSRFRRALDLWCCFKTPEESLSASHRYASDFPLENDSIIQDGGIVLSL